MKSSSQSPAANKRRAWERAWRDDGDADDAATWGHVRLRNRDSALPDAILPLRSPPITPAALFPELGYLPPGVEARSDAPCVARTMRSHPSRIERPWVLLCGPVLRMHMQPSTTGRGPADAPRGRKRIGSNVLPTPLLSNLCWLPPIATVVAHYFRRPLPRYYREGDARLTCYSRAARCWRR